MILQNLLLIGQEYHADLIDVEHDKIISVIIQKGGGHCDWVAIDVTNPQNMWEITFVGTNKPNIENWENGDQIMLGISIQ